MEPRIWGFGAFSICFLLIFLTWIDGNAQSNNCTDGTAGWIANGRCDLINNNDLCDYDGGDCCHCDCVDGSDYSCGDDGFSCVDPTSECINPSAAYPNCSQYWTVGDGACDFDNNNEGCEYDGGDCCECDCTTSSDDTCGSENVYACLDSSSDCVHSLAAEFPSCSGNLDYISDGECDLDNNIQDCGYDGGDCCECDCVDSDYSCGESGFFCLDPLSDCVDAIVTEYPNCTGYLQDVGDGFCNDYNNNDDCGYDGGDCCECDCLSGSGSSCEIYNSFHCLDPASDCAHPLATQFPSCSGILDYVGDQYCDAQNNNEECGYDGGDCCECDCVVSNDYSHCGVYGFLCVDPTSECVGQSEFSGCRGVLDYISDGGCDDENNNEDCGYDGGDCCRCTCVGSHCPTSDADCLDPDGIGSEVYECGESQAAASPCLAGLRRKWVVETTAHAHDLAEASYCANGAFEVEWRGRVIVNQTIFVVDGTVMNITGVGTNATIEGDGATRLFNVISADFRVTDVTLRNGHATSGGSVVAADAKLTFYGTSFIGNSASRRGGAIFASNASAVTFDGTTTLASNFAEGDGGALYISDRSTAFFGGTTTVINNTASYDGGAVYLSASSSSSWTGNATLFANTAEFGSGGALYLSVDSNSSWTGETTFSGNAADWGGGALSVWRGSNAFWSGTTIFSRNGAIPGGTGGAVHVHNATMSWTGKTYFEGNKAESGGALSVEEVSNVSWKGETSFTTNSALYGGGALFVGYVCSVSWEASTLFTENVANTGGAIYILSGSTVEWSEATNFTSNVASLDGGAVSFSGESDYGESQIIFDGTSNFLNNTSGTNGGGMALLGYSSWSGTMNITFAHNTASLGGGAVYVSPSERTSVFSGIAFEFNYAPVGGAVYAPGSSTAADQFGNSVVISTNFSGCSFIGNVAETTGGAVDSASGDMNFIDSSFRTNIASVGGALRLAGTASIENCEFVENSSGVKGGPAVAKIGDKMDITNSSFLYNVYTCGSGMILDVSEEGDLYDTVCSGCRPCQNCVVQDQKAVPQGCISLLDAGIEHATSDGGVIEKLNLSRGYWRATNASRDILECFNRKACLGGVALRVSDYCKKGFKGPYCSLCEDGYTGGVGFTCIKCTPSNKTLSIALVTSLAAIVVVACVAIVLHLLSGEMAGTSRGCIDRMSRRIPLQCVKIIIVAWQILTQVESVTKATYPGIYKPFLDVVNIVTFNFTRPLMIGCFMKTNFHDQLLLATIGPIIGMSLLALTYAIALRKHRGSEESIRAVQQKHMSMALFITFLVYSTVSSTIFQTFACEALDTDDPLRDKEEYLIADYSIKCDGEHKKYQTYAGFMVMLYPVGIPATYAILLFRRRHILEDKSRREGHSGVRAMVSLWEPYKPSRFYYEIVECGRRAMLTSVLLLIKGGTAAQIAVTIVLAFFFAVTFEVLSPYESLLDTWVSRLGHAVIFSSMYLALLIKVDVSEEAEDSQDAFGAVLVAVHVCMMLVVVMESIFVSFALKVDKCEDPRPRQRSSNSISVMDVDDDDSGKKKNDPWTVTNEL